MSMRPTSTGIGQPVRRREDLRLLTGQGRYSDDVNVPGQAYAVMLRSPHAHALIRAIDTRAAEAAPDVLAVLTGRDLLADGLRAIPHAVRMGHPADIQLENKDGSEPFVPPHFAMATDEVRHVGEIVAVVVATSVTAAKDAAELVEVDYAPLPAVTQSRSAVAPDAPLTRSDAASNVCLDAEAGDARATEAAFADAAHVVSFSTWVQRIAGVTMEPRAAVGAYDAATGRYTLHAGAGGAVRPRHDMAVVLGVPDEQVRMVMHDVGGNFGTRGASNPEFAHRPVGGATCRPPGEVDLRTQRSIPLRLPGARSGLRCGAGPGCTGQVSSRCAAPTSSTTEPIRSPSVRCRRAWRS